jgi:hypothetical protein
VAYPLVRLFASYLVLGSRWCNAIRLWLIRLHPHAWLNCPFVFVHLIRCSDCVGATQFVGDFSSCVAYPLVRLFASYLMLGSCWYNAIRLWLIRLVLTRGLIARCVFASYPVLGWRWYNAIRLWLIIERGLSLVRPFASYLVLGSRWCNAIHCGAFAPVIVRGLSVRLYLF